jgi:hypothetical protein
MILQYQFSVPFTPPRLSARWWCVCCCYCGRSAGNAAVLSDSSGGTGSLVSVDSTSTQASAICQVDWLCPLGHGCDVATQTKVRALAMHESRI